MKLNQLFEASGRTEITADDLYDHVHEVVEQVCRRVARVVAPILDVNESEPKVHGMEDDSSVAGVPFMHASDADAEAGRVAAGLLARELRVGVKHDPARWRSVAAWFDKSNDTIGVTIGSKGLARALTNDLESVVGVWTETFSHEMQHYRQKMKGEIQDVERIDMDDPQAGSKYLAQDHEVDAFARSTAGALVKKFGAKAVKSFTSWPTSQLQRAYAESMGVRKYWFSRRAHPDIWNKFAMRVQQHARGEVPEPSRPASTAS